MTTLAVISQIAIAVVLVFSGLSKLIAGKDVLQTLRHLGVPELLVTPTAVGLVALELTVATALLVFPTAGAPRFAVGALGTGFAAAGLRAMIAKQRIPCNCLGHIGSGNLGWRQLQLLPAWLALPAVGQADPPAWGWRQGLIILVGILAALVVLQLRTEWRIWIDVQGDRLAVIFPCNPKSKATLVAVGSEVRK
jgi:hypothetical protein